MNIERITLKNFRNHRFSVIDFTAPISILTGVNASGKSSIKEAILYALCGCGRNEITRKNLSNIISYGLVKAEVEIIININNTHLKITRSRTTKSESLKLEENGKPLSDTPSNIQQHIYEALGIDKRLLSFAFDGSLIYQMNSKDLRDFVFDLMQIKVKKEDLIGALRCTAIEDKYWKDLLNLAIAENFQAASKMAIEQRKTAKREMEKNIKPIPDRITINDREHHLNGINIKGIEKDLDDIKKKKESLLVEKGRLDAQKMQDPSALTLSKNHLAKSLKEAEEKLKMLKECDHQHVKTQSLEQIEKLNYQIAQEQKKLLEAKTLLEGKEKINLGDFSGHCLCFPDLDCYSSEHIKKKEALIQNEIHTLQKRIDDAAKNEKQLQDSLRIKNELLNNINQKIEEEKSLKQQIADKKLEISRIDEEIKRFSLDKANADAAKLEAVLDDIRNINLQIQFGTTLISKAMEWNEYQKQLKVQMEAKEQVRIYDTLANFFSSEGYISKILNSSLAPLYERLKITQQLLGYPVSFDKEFNILADGKSIKNLSESERYRLGIILQDSFMHLTGLKTMVIDEVNILDQQNKGLLLNILLKLQGDYENIILFSTIGDVHPKPSFHPLISMIRVDNGKVYPILKKAA